MKTFFRISKNWLIAAAVVTLMMAATAPVRADGKTADLHYLAVGVSKVPALPASNQLRFAHKDAQDLAKVWQSQKGRLYGNVHGETLTNENAKRADILAALDRLEANAKTGDTAVVSFAGHGGVIGQRVTQWFFVPNDFSPANIQQTAVYEWQLRASLAKLTARGVTVILMIDTCHAGSFSSADSGVVVIAACSSLEESFEDQAFQNGLFTHALIEALQGQAAANQSGIVTVAAVETYLSQRVAEMHAKNPCYDRDGRRIEQSPTFVRPAANHQEIALGGMPANTIQTPVQGTDRFRVQPTDR